MALADEDQFDDGAAATLAASSTHKPTPRSVREIYAAVENIKSQWIMARMDLVSLINLFLSWREKQSIAQERALFHVFRFGPALDFTKRIKAT